MVRNSLNAAYLGMVANIRAVISDTYRKERPVHKDLFNIIKTDQPFFNDEAVTGMGLFQEKTEEKTGFVDQIYHLYNTTYIPITYSLMVKFSSECVEDDRLGIIKSASKGIGSSAVISQDTLAALLLNTAFSSVGADGTYLCSSSHPLVEGGSTWRNRPTNGMALTRSNLALAIVDWMDQMVNERGQKIDIDIARLVTGATLALDASEILNSIDRPDTANRAKNVIKSDFNIQPVVWKRINDPKFWFLLAPKEQHHINVVVKKPLTVYHGVNQEEGYVWERGEFRMNYGWSLPQGIWGSPGIGG